MLSLTRKISELLPLVFTFINLEIKKKILPPTSKINKLGTSLDLRIKKTLIVASDSHSNYLSLKFLQLEKNITFIIIN